MIHSLSTLAIFGAIAAALPAPTPVITPAPDISKRQDDAVTAVGCTITFKPESEFVQTNIEVDETGGITSIPTTISLPAGNGCNCEGNVIAGIYETVGRDGLTTQYCATGDPTAPQSTRIAEPTPGAPDNAGWAQVQCADGSLTDIFNNPWEQWNDSGAAGAWNSLMANWNTEYDPVKKESLSNFLGNYFNTKPNTYCERLDNSACTDSIQCGQNFEGGDATTPAGYAILNSFIGAHTMFEDMYSGIDSALSQVLGRVGSFVETFSPINEDIEDQKRQKIAFDIAQAAMFGVLAPTFHSGFSRSKWVRANPNIVAAGFDFTYGMIGTSFAIAKDAMDSLSTLPVQNELSGFVVETAKGWLAAVSEATKGVLNDPNNAFAYIDQGKFFPGDGPADPIEATAFVEKALLAGTLSAVWVTGDPSQHAPPVIVLPDDVPQDGTGCASYKPEDYEWGGEGDRTTINFADDVLTSAFTCIGETAYWLMGPMVDEDEVCYVPGTSYPSDCPVKGIRFDSMYGIDKLGDFNLTKEEVVGNAVNSWAANGNKNGWDPLQLAGSDEGEIGDLINTNLGSTKGAVKIPVCTFNDIMTYFNENPNTTGEDNPNHPCPP